MSILFVTGTDTGVGKTVTTAALVACSRASGGSPYVVKPAQTGVTADEPGDLDDVRRLAGDVPGTEGIRLRLPLAPDTAARLEGTVLPSLDVQSGLVLGASVDADPVLVEGAGGILVRIGPDYTLLDLAERVRSSGVDVGFVVVARAGLGTLNHTGLTVSAILARGLPVRGVVIGAWPEEPDLAAEQNLLDLPAQTGVPVIGTIPAGTGSLGSAEFTARAPDWLALDLD